MTEEELRAALTMFCVSLDIDDLEMIDRVVEEFIASWFRGGP